MGVYRGLKGLLLNYQSTMSAPSGAKKGHLQGSFIVVSPMNGGVRPDGAPHVSKPQDVKRGMHVEWDAATGTFKVRDVTNYSLCFFQLVHLMPV